MIPVVRLRFRSRMLACAVAVLACAPALAADYHLILSGSGGEPEYSERFRDWSLRLRDALIARADVPGERIRLLAEPHDSAGPDETPIDLESIRAEIAHLAETLDAEDTLFIYLIGHGSYINRESRFLIPGPDLTAEQLGEALDAVGARRIVVVNGASSSAGFINVLSGPQRIIVTATKSATERNATRYMGFFVESIEDGSADRNRDERISVLEAAEQAAELTATWYQSEGLIATESAILDDNADGLGSRLPIPGAALAVADDDPRQAPFDGSLARETFLKDYAFPDAVPRELIDTYLALLDDIADLRARKRDTDETAYYAELEKLLIRAARANREIRSIAPIPDADS